MEEERERGSLEGSHRGLHRRSARCQSPATRKWQFARVVGGLRVAPCPAIVWNRTHAQQAQTPSFQASGVRAAATDSMDDSLDSFEEQDLDSEAEEVSVFDKIVTVLSCSGSSKDAELQQLMTLSLDASNASAIVAAGAVRPLVELLQRDIMKMSHQVNRIRAAGILANLVHAPRRAPGESLRMDSTVAFWASEAIPALVDIVCGGLDNSGHALRALALFSTHDANKCVAFIAIVPTVAVLLEDYPPATKDHAACVLRNLATLSDDARIAISDAGAVPPLVALAEVQAKDPLVRFVHAALALTVLSRHVATKRLIEKTKLARAEAAKAKLDAAGVDELVTMLRGPIVDRPPVLARLVELSRDSSKIAAFVAANAVAPLVAQLWSDAHVVKMNAATTLANLAEASETRGSIGQQGAIVPLVALVRRCAVSAGGAARALANICAGNDANKKLSIAAGAIVPMTALLTQGGTVAKGQAVRYLCNVMSVDSNVTSVAIAAAGAIPAIVDWSQRTLPDSDRASNWVKKNAQMALTRLSNNEDNRALIAAEQAKVALNQAIAMAARANAAL